jgi:hypothetical protein
MLAYCRNHPEAKLPGENDYERFGFKLVTENRQYFIRCAVDKSIYNINFIIYAYDKAAAIEQDRAAGEKPSVMKQIRDAQKTPKPPRKAKSPEKKKAEAEL